MRVRRACHVNAPEAHKFARHEAVLDYCAATLLDCSARPLSITVRQPALSSDRRFTMQAVIFGILGISELHRRNASPVHICCASALKAKLWVEQSPDSETAKTSTKPAWRSVLMRDEVMFGSRLYRRISGALLMPAYALLARHRL
jgi:hypothetical protein